MNWVQIAFKIFANRDKYLQIYEQVKPLIRELPQVHAALAEIDPSLNEGTQPEPSFTVEWMQESLNSLIGSNLVVDGDYGEQTRAAVRKFQEDHGLDADGWAGLKTCVEIYKQLQGD